MGIAKKNKRKLIFQEQTFYWWISDEFDGNRGMLAVNIATEDKAFLVKYYAIQNQEMNRHLAVIGKDFPGMQRKKGNWERFVCPDFIPSFHNNGIGPRHIQSILEWCYDLEKPLIPVNNKGERITG